MRWQKSQINHYVSISAPFTRQVILPTKKVRFLSLTLSLIVRGHSLWVTLIQFPPPLCHSSQAFLGRRLHLSYCQRCGAAHSVVGSSSRSSCSVSCRSTSGNDMSCCHGPCCTKSLGVHRVCSLSVCACLRMWEQGMMENLDWLPLWLQLRIFSVWMD